MQTKSTLHHKQPTPLELIATKAETRKRATAPLAQLSMLTVVQALAAGALHGALDHHDGSQRVKRVIQAFEAIAKPLQLVADKNG